jgi:hypothetical protein
VIKPFDASSFEQVCNSLIRMFPELRRLTASSTKPPPPAADYSKARES